ncbi:hypothetical protein [Mucilaginibacter sp.]|uniref:hypothetical protein n=1 Tax=Mucilaginibacter sp. TaxID=1882438 RepID=UPI0035BC938C
MKHFYKIIFTALIAVTLLHVSCKKSDNVAPTKELNTADISKRIALNLYRSLSTGVTATGSNGVKTSGARTVVTMDANTCGQVATTLTNTSAVNGDTTTSYAGRRVFTYKCDGFFHDGVTLDAYNLIDTLTKTQKGAGFNNSYSIALNYNVKSLEADYSKVSVNGFTSTTEYNSKVSGTAVTSFNKIATGYTWDNITANRTPNDAEKATFVSGRVQFVTNITAKEADATTESTVIVYNGTMDFMPGNLVKMIVNVGTATKTYMINLVTGELTAI